MEVILIIINMFIIIMVETDLDGSWWKIKVTQENSNEGKQVLLPVLCYLLSNSSCSYQIQNQHFTFI